MSKIHIRGIGVTVDVDMSRFEEKLPKAQKALDRQVLNDMIKYMPLDSGELIRETININTAGSGKVYAFPPNSEYGHYQWEGYVYADPFTGKGAFYSDEYGFWSRPGVPKVKTDRKLEYSENKPLAERHWNEVAIRNHRREWAQVVKNAFKNA